MRRLDRYVDSYFEVTAEEDVGYRRGDKTASF